MADFHLDIAALDELLRLNDHRIQKDALLHLLSSCPECARMGAYLLEAARAGRLPRDYSVPDAEFARSRAEAPVLWKRLARLPYEKQRGVIRDTNRFLSWGLCELLGRESEKVAAGDATRAVELAELAVLVAERLRPGEPAEEEWLLGLRALAWGYLGNARRVLGELRAAEEAFSRAAELWKKSEDVGDPLGYGPILLDLKASLRRDQRRFDEALDLLDQVVTAYRDGDPGSPSRGARPDQEGLHVRPDGGAGPGFTISGGGSPARGRGPGPAAVPLPPAQRRLVSRDSRASRGGPVPGARGGGAVAGDRQRARSGAAAMGGGADRGGAR